MNQEVDKGSEVKEQTLKPSPPITISNCAYLLLTLFFALLIIDRLTLSEKFTGLFQSLIGKGILVILFALLAAGVWKTKSRLHQLLTAKQFAIAVLAWLLGFTILGTLIVQSGSREELAEVYGKNLSDLIYLSGFNDLFHSIWFAAFLVLLSVSLVLVVIKRKSWRFPEWGNLFAHLGIVVILLGGFLGYFFGFKGMIDLQIGESATAAMETKLGIRTDQIQPLDFSLRLLDFQVEHYQAEYKLYLYQGAGGEFAVRKTFELKEVSVWTEIADSSVQFRVTKVFPDFYFQTELKEASPESGKPALELQIAQGAEKKSEILFAGEPDQDSISISPEQTPVRFVWEPLTRAELDSISKTRPAAHIITFEKAGCCPRQELEVKPGGEYNLGHGGMYQLKVLQFLPDFVYDIEQRKPATRSQDPNNPALLVSLTETATGAGQEQWLFARVPEFGKTHGKEKEGPELNYNHLDASPPPDQEILIVGKTREAVILEQGSLSKQFALPQNGAAIAGTPILGFKIYASAEESKNPATRSQEWKNPVVELEIKNGDEVQTRLLSSGHQDPVFLPDEKSALAFQTREEDVKSFRSKLAVIQDDRKVLEKTVAVNDPLYYRGWGFYQSNYKKEDPTYSGIMVVRDPGLWLVWIGFGMISLGLVFIYYVKPGLKAVKKSQIPSPLAGEGKGEGD